MDFEFQFGRAGARRREESEPFRILLLADLRGASASEAPEVEKRRIVSVDVDNFDELMARFAPSVALGPEQEDSRLCFRCMEDFHPDELFEKAELFRQLRSLRARLENTDTFAEAAAELRSGPPLESHGAPVPTADAADNMFESLLGQRTAGETSTVPREATARTAVERLIHGIVAPHIVAAPDPQLPQFLSAVDASIGDAMRGLLHYSAFQAVESAWRGVEWLMSSLELGEEIELHLLHCTRAELAENTGPQSALHRRLVEDERIADGRSWGALVGNYVFGGSVDDMQLLESLGRLAAGANAPFVAGASPELLGCEAIDRQADPREWKDLDAEMAERWSALRASPAAGSIVLALPRVLLRTPYGLRSDRIESFEFEEILSGQSHESYLWGNAAFACAMVLARASMEDAFEDPGAIDDLPTHVSTNDRGESFMKPCAEVCLTDRAVQAVVDAGLTPVVSYKNRNAVRFATLRTVASG